MGTILANKLLSHFTIMESNYANYILTWVVHNIVYFGNKYIRHIFNTQSKQEDDSLFSKIKSLNRHYS